MLHPGDMARKKSKKKTKSLLTSINQNPTGATSKDKSTLAAANGKMVPDIDMNTLAKKYKQMRKNGEYHGGLSSDA